MVAPQCTATTGGQTEKIEGFCLIAFVRPLQSPAYFHIHVCMYWFNNNDAMNILAKPTQVTCEYLCILEMWYKVCCDLFM